MTTTRHPDRWLRPSLADLPTYGSGSTVPSGGISHKLSSNENPYPPPDAVLAAIDAAARTANRYPSPLGHDVVPVVAARHNLPTDRVAVGGGSLVLLQQAVMAIAEPGEEVVLPWRSYEAYPIIVQSLGCRPVRVPLVREHVDLDALAERIGAATRIVIVPNPNNPTGTAFGADELLAFLSRVPSRCLVLLDEAYSEFVTDPDHPDALGLQASVDNLLVVRTLSKAFSMAGLRAAWCAGHPDIVAALERVAIPFTLNRLASAALVALDGDVEREMRGRVASIVAERARVIDGLRALGFDVPPSQANFVWLPLGPDGDLIVEACGRRGVSVRQFDEGVRISIGSAASNDLVLEAAAECAATPAPAGAVAPAAPVTTDAEIA